MWLEQLRDFTARRALALAIASATLFVALTILWLSVSTRAAILNRQFDALEVRRLELEREIADIQEQISDATSSPVIEQRMRAAGFQEPEQVRFLIAPAPTATITITTEAPASGTSGGTP
ncbi:MAG: hypothetical protein RMN25_02870 [Anaerolineae bacterium]|nr:hypothetical protein [Thermoflexales bacterium]MDW8406699.1 hypothetical protein [Anaerolineae bacterium]